MKIFAYIPTKIHTILILFGSMVICSNLTGQIEHQKKNRKYDFSAIEKKIQAWVVNGYYSGASILITKNDAVIYQKYFGNYNKETQVFIASAGKWLAAATIAAVVEKTTLSWDDKVKKWLPEFQDAKGEATLRQLFSHTSGFPDYQPKDSVTDNYQTLEESVKHIVNLPADSQPGTAFHYGGLAMQVAGRMAELATGKDFETIFQENIAMPLGMKNTHFVPVDNGGGHSPMLGGGAKSTLYDYAHFLEMISHDGNYKGNQILKKESVAEMQADQIRNANVASHEYTEQVRAEKQNGIYGLGEWREEVDAKGNAILISSPSWAGAYPWIDKTTQTYGFFLTHVNVEKANKAGFSSFYNSPVLPIMVRDVYKNAALPKNVKTGFVNVGNAKLYYEESGTGEPLIFIHGHSFDHSEWDPQFFEFAKKYRTVRYDCRGYGHSDMPKEGVEFLHAEDLLKLMNKLKIKKAHLVGLSMGGFIATDFLALHQDRLLSATMASGDIFPVPGPSQPWTTEQFTIRKAEIEKIIKRGTMYQKWDWLNGLMSKGGTNLEKIRKPVWDMIFKWNQWQPLHAEPRLVLGNDAEAILKKQKITVPVMVLTGEVEKERPNKLLECVPSAKQVIVSNAGHVSNLENPEDFNRLVMEFLKNN
ncbi:serine hydrolase [Flavobacterium cheongpyeongense]|jgi:CubicO group peptidase (beta-lactamase class C family)/pimeloyl-ACP methyl ester carboxylesterase|uniref:Serine hydrolase n=1 Tax=Flavobacterium cheongpyeongense TaxID=2212651 RepID=A0A2V4BJQ3_9FLAO|nr:alpha/beta fold hydrolase [Flavobacterium cheongpyeongense]PXY39208.1 serine hydrolase [Flavobacterium cheongpyeongense]